MYTVVTKMRDIPKIQLMHHGPCKFATHGKCLYISAVDYFCGNRNTEKQYNLDYFFSNNFPNYIRHLSRSYLVVLLQMFI